MLKTLLLLQLLSLIRGNLINLKMERDISIQSQLARISTKIVFANTAPDQANSYVYLIDGNVTDYHIKFTTIFEDVLYHTAVGRDGHIEVHLRHPLDLDEVREMLVEEVHVNRLRTVLKKKPVDDYDVVRYDSNNNCFSVYETLSCVSNYTFSNFLQYDEKNRQNNRIHYDFRSTLMPFAVNYIDLVFVTKVHFMHVRLDRIIDVSHYGKITVWDTVELVDLGAKIDGPYDSKRKHKEYMFTHLPSSAEDVVLYDPLGVRYNYRVINTETHQTLKFTSRYPMFGGWKTSYTVKYNLPIYEYLYSDGSNKYLLKMRVFDHILNDAVIDELIVKILLPENSLITSRIVPKPFIQLNDTWVITHLSCFGRPAVRIGGSNLVEDHIADFGIEYDIEPTHLLRVPFKLGGYCYALFATYIFLSRLSRWFAL